jgi:RNA polymerase sigma-70 factor (ECF subfamily)
MSGTRAAGSRTATAVWMPAGRPRVVYSFTIRDERIITIDLIADPARLDQLDLTIPND